MHYQCGHHARAIELIEQSIAIRPDNASYHANLGEVQRSLKHYVPAAASCRRALSLKPDYPEALNNFGLILHEMGQNEEAIALLDAALTLQPDFALAQNNKGSALRALGRVAEAIEAYRAAIVLEPTLGRAHANLAQILTDRGEPAEALAHAREAVKHQPDLSAGHNSLGNVLRALGRGVEAAGAYAEAVRLQPDLAVAHANLGLVLLQAGKSDAALAHFQKAVELSPDDPAAHQQLAEAHVSADDWAAAIPCLERLVALEPANPDAHSRLGLAYQNDERYTKAEVVYLRALELQPDHLDARLNLGSLHEELGRMAEAEACFREAEACHPHASSPLVRRALLLRGKLPASDRDRLRFELYKRQEAGLRSNLLFALAQVADARGDYAEAAACLEPANGLARDVRRGRGETYDADEHSRHVDKVIAAFPPEVFRRLAGAGDPSARPVFVFGLPRSGTTLVEQVLSSHSHVFGAGELRLMNKALTDLPTEDVTDGQPPTLDALDAEGLRKFARGYQDGVRERLDRQDRDTRPERVVDKMPDNYGCLGLIALMFPNATLIHVRRDVRDVAVSCWMTLFRSIRWADDQGDLIRRILDYRRLMDHWRAVLPRPVHEVRYECLVDDFEAEARRLVATCGLEWEPACLRFHETVRPARTASFAQVRQPLYRQSLGRWRAYEPYLSPLFESLRDPDHAGSEP